MCLRLLINDKHTTPYSIGVKTPPGKGTGPATFDKANRAPVECRDVCEPQPTHERIRAPA